MPTQKPTSFINWVPDSSSTSLAVPPNAISTTGFQPSQPVPAQWLNYLLRTLDQWNQYLAEGINSTVLATSLDHSMRLIGGGTWLYTSATGALSWSAAFQLACPSAPDANNQAAAGQVTLNPGDVAYVTANLPFSTVGDVTSGSATIANLGYEGGIAVGQAVSGAGIANGTTVVAVSQDTCTISTPATSSATQTSLTFVGTGPLTVSAAASAALVPGPNTVIIARSLGAVCSVGVGSTEMWLRDQEQRSLVTAGYVTTVQAPAGVALNAYQAVYLSQGTADGRTQGSLYPCDAGSTNGANRAYPVGFMHTATAAGAQAHVVQGGFLQGFSALTPGAVYYLDPQTPGGITPTKPTGSGQYVSAVGVAINTTTLLVDIGVSVPVTTTFPQITVLGTSALQDVQVAGTLGVKPAGDGSQLWTVNNSGAARFQSVYSQAGFKSVVDMGYYASTSYPGGIQQTGIERLYQGGNTHSFSGKAFFPTANGSVMGISGSAYFNGSTNFTVYLYRITPSGAQTQYVNQGLGNINGAYMLQFAKGQYIFNPGDIIFVSVGWGASGVQASAVDTQLTVEMTA